MNNNMTLRDYVSDLELGGYSVTIKPVSLDLDDGDLCGTFVCVQKGPFIHQQVISNIILKELNISKEEHIKLIIEKMIIDLNHAMF